jgi:hypothetical protein
VARERRDGDIGMGHGGNELVPGRKRTNIIVVVLGTGAKSRYSGSVSGLGR